MGLILCILDLESEFEDFIGYRLGLRKRGNKQFLHESTILKPMQFFPYSLIVLSLNPWLYTPYSPLGQSSAEDLADCVGGVALSVGSRAIDKQFHRRIWRWTGRFLWQGSFTKKPRPLLTGAFEVLDL
jgi:hypothetical protein